MKNLLIPDVVFWRYLKTRTGEITEMVACIKIIFETISIGTPDRLAYVAACVK